MLVPSNSSASRTIHELDCHNCCCFGSYPAKTPGCFQKIKEEGPPFWWTVFVGDFTFLGKALLSIKTMKFTLASHPTSSEQTRVLGSRLGQASCSFLGLENVNVICYVSVRSCFCRRLGGPYPLWVLPCLCAQNINLYVQWMPSLLCAILVNHRP